MVKIMVTTNVLITNHMVPVKIDLVVNESNQIVMVYVVVIH